MKTYERIAFSILIDVIFLTVVWAYSVGSNAGVGEFFKITSGQTNTYGMIGSTTYNTNDLTITQPGNTILTTLSGLNSIKMSLNSIKAFSGAQIVTVEQTAQAINNLNPILKATTSLIILFLVLNNTFLFLEAYRFIIKSGGS